MANSHVLRALLGALLLTTSPFAAGCPAGDDDDATGDDDDSGDDDDDSALTDADGDGVPAAEDCDDNDEFNFPGNVEDCFDNQDNDCDTLVDRAEMGDQYLDVAAGAAYWMSDPLIDYSGSYTVETWVSVDQQAVGDTRLLWHKGSGSGTGGSYVILDVYGGNTAGANGAPQLETNANGAVGTTTGQVAPTTAGWHHFAAVMNGATEMVDYYVDGVPAGSVLVDDGGYFGETIQPAGDIMLGGTGTEAASINLDDMRIWGDARTAQEIADGMCTPMASTEPDLMVNFTFETSALDGADVGPYSLQGISSSQVTIGVY
jgi:hypothetical protein